MMGSGRWSKFFDTVVLINRHWAVMALSYNSFGHFTKSLIKYFIIVKGQLLKCLSVYFDDTYSIYQNMLQI